MNIETGPSWSKLARELKDQIYRPDQTEPSFKLAALLLLISTILTLIASVFLGSFSGIQLISIAIQIGLVYGLYKGTNNIQGITKMYLTYNAVMVFYLAYKGVISGNPVLVILTQYSFLASAYIQIQGPSSIRKYQISITLFILYLLLWIYGLLALVF